MSFYGCMSAVMTALGRRVSMDEFDALYTRLDEERARLFAKGYPSDWLSAARTVAQQIEIEKAIAQRQVIRNKLVYGENRGFIAAARAQGVDGGRALEARLVGINKPIEGGRKSVAAESHGLYLTSAGALLADLRRAGGDKLVKLFSTPAYEIEIARALRGEAAPAEAKAIAAAIEKAREDLRRQENDAGGWRGKLDGYVTRQSHDSLRVRRSGFEKWKAFILPMLDQARTFDRQEELLVQLRHERGQVLQHRLAAGADLRAMHEELRTADRLDEKATERGRRLDAQERTQRAQVDQGRREMAAALGRYMELQERARGGPTEAEAAAARLTVEQHDVRVAEAESRLDEGRREARAALARYYDLAERARAGAADAAPLLGEPGRADVPGRQLAEARLAMNRARERVNDLHDRVSGARFAREDAVAAKTGVGRVEITGRQLAEARIALNRAKSRLQALHDQASAGRGRSIESDLVRQHLAERVETAAAIAERAERGVGLLDDLAGKMVEYEKRLKGAVDPDAFLRQIYNAIAADTQLRGASQEFTGLLSHIGPANISRKRAAHRELHFKSADDEVGYMRRYGAGGVADTVLRELEGAATATSLLRNLGPNPEAMFQLLRTEMLKEAKDTGNNELTRALNRKRLDWQLAEVTGASRAIANPTIASWGASIRVVQSMAKLGGAMLSSFGDVATAAAELRYQGRGALSSYADMFEGMLKGRRGGERRVIADLLGVGFESLSGQVLARLGGESAPPGGLAKAAALYFRLNGLSWWTDTHKTTAGLVISRYFAAMKASAFDALPAPTQRLLGQFGLKSADWDVLRQAAVHAAEDGTEFLTPEGVRQIPLGWFMAKATDIDPSVVPSERAMRETRDRLVSAYSMLITDRVDHAVVSPGARERALIAMGTERGDVLGESLRFVMQFKSFGIAMAQKSLGRDVYGGGSKLSATVRTMSLAFQLTAFGYLSMAAKDALAGKTPRDPLAVETYVAAAAQGGGMGIMGDFVFGEFNRFGRSALATAAGPTFGTVDDLLELWAKARDTDKMARGKYGSDLAASTLRTVVSNTPFASLFWLRPAVNYLALYPIQEALNPGHLRRMEARIQRENKQTFWAPPSQYAPRL